MNTKERGFLLLTSTFGDPDRKPLTVAQFRTLADRVSRMEKPNETRQLAVDDLLELGYDRQMAFRIVSLLEGQSALTTYIQRGKQQGCIPISRISDYYPLAVRQRLGLDAPGCLWAKGDVSLFATQKISLVGSRELRDDNRLFAEMVGREAAKQGITLVSGNATGADRTAQEACVAAGGRVICVVADELMKCPLTENILYLSEDGFDLPFSAQRALSRNRVIHTLGYLTFVAQCTMGTGGTWDGTTRNLRNGWSPVYCFFDGSAACGELQQLGATMISGEQLTDLAGLHPDVKRLI